MNPSDGKLSTKAIAAFRQAARKVIERARQTGTPIIVWEDGKVVKRTWQEMEQSLGDEAGKELDKSP
jgi:hypothetical protein